ncbi:glycoside hydrolase family 99-like domain-containing protein [Chromohalobacter canadensis]|uniref:glycoside hydrolase family 99-like domain-containing protein n=1 Tax=Chromohalobacter canadensis TaxID=141389 RepID=UPI002410AB34|nr:glycoside hydrolase family 99-like domain-containing protein [Chromohalobacter canadensis]
MKQIEQTTLAGTGERFMPEFDGSIVAEHLHRYLLARRHVEGLAVLDIASGEGYGSHLLAERAASVVGVDIDRDSIAHAKATYQRENLEYLIGDCADIPLPNDSFDVVVSFETIEHHDRHAEMLEEIKRVLRPDGLLILSSPDRYEYSTVRNFDNPYHVRELYRHEFEALLSEYFAHHTLLPQRVVYGSAIFGGQGDESLLTYSTDHADGRPGLPDPMYWIALASDADKGVPAVASSFYRHSLEHSDEVLQLERSLDEHEDEIAQQRSAIDERESRIATMQAALSDQTQAIETRDRQLEELRLERDERIAALQTSENHTRWMYSSYFHLQSRARSPGWLLKRFVARLVQLPAEYWRASHERSLIVESGLFDADWYREQNPDVHELNLDPLHHYHRHGGYEGRAASPDFDTGDYLRRHPELATGRQHPLLHYLETIRHKAGRASAGQNGAETGEGITQVTGDRLFPQLFEDASQVSENRTELTDHHLDGDTRIRAIALYLPQFHPIAENDRWWGKGFTEWTNVSKAVPQFVGHEQPRLPGELGFYDLRLPQVQERQVELARQHGLEAFCFHYYWFSGRKRLLYTPIEQYVANPNIDFPFCICWANENWTRRWDGQENDVLMAQRHEPHDDLEFIEDLAPLLEDHRYLRVDGKPLLIVYRIDILPDARKTAETWREYCRERGIGEIHLVAAQSFGIGDPTPYGFDAAVEFPPHGLQANQMASELEFLNPDFAGRVYDYHDVVNTQLAKPAPDYRLYQTVFPAWDNEARKPGRGHIFHRASPAAYRRWLAHACRHADHNGGDGQLVFINAWNEWAEGAYLEPDRRHGYAYLQATQQVLAQFPAPASDDSPRAIRAMTAVERHHDTAVVLHLYYPDLWDEISPYLAHLNGDYDLYVTLPESASDEAEARVRRDVPEARFARVANRGRDISPFLEVLRGIMEHGYGQVCKVHAKRSVHRGDGDDWRREMFGSLLGSAEKIAAIRSAFEKHGDLGLVGPAGHWLSYTRYWGIHPESPARVKALLKAMGSETPLDSLNFFAGSMFWCRPEALKPLLDNVDWDDFEHELGQTDGALGHILERVIPHACQHAGFSVADTRHPDDPTALSQPLKHYAYAAPCPAPDAVADPQPARQWPGFQARLRQLARKSALARRVRREILNRIG